MLFIAIPLILGSPWIFLYLSPSGVDRRKLRRFNAAVLGLGVLLCLGLAAWVRSTMVGSDEAQWWPIVAIVYAAVLFPATLLIGGLIRNFMVFR